MDAVSGAGALCVDDPNGGPASCTSCGANATNMGAPLYTTNSWYKRCRCRLGYAPTDSNQMNCGTADGLFHDSFHHQTGFLSNPNYYMEGHDGSCDSCVAATVC